MAPRVDLERAPAPVVVAGSDDGLERSPSRSTALQVGTGRPAVSVRQGESADAAKDGDGHEDDDELLSNVVVIMMMAMERKIKI